MSMSYTEAQEMLKRTRGGRRKLENNTWLEERGCDRCKSDADLPADYHPGQPVYAIRLHNTDVVTLYPDGSYTLDSGGWRTVTTKDRINHYAPGSVSSIKGVWYYRPEPGNWDLRYKFEDGMVVTASGVETLKGRVA